MPGTPSPAGRSFRIVRRSALWFSEGRQQKAEARRAHRCVECRALLPSGRTPYCGRVCQWKFQGRYFWDAARVFVIHRDRFTCRVCGRRRRVRDLEVDHVREIAAGGRSLDYANLQTLCRTCHRDKTRRFLRSRGTVGAASRSIGGLRDGSDGVEWSVDWFPA